MPFPHIEIDKFPMVYKEIGRGLLKININLEILDGFQRFARDSRVEGDSEDQETVHGESNKSR